MRVTIYNTLLNDNYYPAMFKESAVNYKAVNLNTPEIIVKMMNDIFKSNMRSEEYLYELCFTTRMNLIGVFEVSHGSISQTMICEREISQKALLCGAASIVLVHNHPSKDSAPSRDDIIITEHLEDAGKLIGIPIVDHIIIGKDFFSFLKEGIIKKEESV